MADLILSLLIVVWLQIRIKATDDNIYSMKEESDFFFPVATSRESVKCPERNVLSSARVTDSL